MRAALCIAILVLATFATFGSVIGHEFAGFDDNLTLYDNPRMKPMEPQTVLHSVRWYWTHTEYDLYTPLTQEVWALLVMLAKTGPPAPGPTWLRPGVFHAANLLFHIGSALMVFAILRLLMRKDFAALAGALLFALHPIQTECIGWASGLKDVMAGFFALAALWQYLIFASSSPAGSAVRTISPHLEGSPSSVERQSVRTADPTKHRVHYVFSAILLVLANLSKPAAMVMPALALGIDLLILRRPWRRALLGAAGLMLVIAPLIIVAAVAQSAPLQKQYVYPLWEHPLIAADALAFYLEKLFIPIDFSPDYGRNPATALRHGWLWWTWMIPVAVSVILWRKRKTAPWLAAGGLILLLALLPVLGLTNFGYERLSTTADHYLYLALFGPALALGFAAAFLAKKITPAPAAFIVGTILLLLAIDSSTQIALWHDNLTLWTHAVEAAPDGFAAKSRLGALYEKQSPPAYDKTFKLYQEALQLAPDSFTLHDDMGMLLLHMNRPEEAIGHMKQTIEIEDHDMNRPPIGSSQYQHQVESRYDLGLYFLQHHRAAEAEEYFRRALGLDPTYQPAIEGLAQAEKLMPPAH